MANQVQQIALDKLVDHPDNPNRMSKAVFSRLVRNIERTGNYEPLVVRGIKDREGYFQIINGHHRCKALEQLSHSKADCVVWDVDDGDVDILLMSLNRLGGSDIVGKRIELLKRLEKQMNSSQMSKLLPQTAGQIDKLINIARPKMPFDRREENMPQAIVFFVSEDQKQIVERAISLVDSKEQTKAKRRADAIVIIAKGFINGQ